MNCEVCGSVLAKQILDLGNHPLCDDLIPFGNTTICKEYPIQIAFCTNCNTAYQLHQVSKEKLFPSSYHYRARMTPSVLRFMEDLVNDAEKLFGNLTGLTVLDIGCNDGSLLSKFKSRGCRTIGIDPTDASQDAEAAGHEIFKEYFDQESADNLVVQNIRPDIITFTNVFAHIENLPLLISALNTVAHEKTIFIIENHYMGSIFESEQFDTFYHEHPRTYSANSFSHIARSLQRDLIGVQFPKRYGGNIRAWISLSNTFTESKLTFDPFPFEHMFFHQFLDLSNSVKDWTKSTKELLRDAFMKFGRLPAKAFPGRAAILLKLLGLDYHQISAIYEIKGSIKTGYYAPGTRIPILPESTLYSSGYQGPIINFAWHIAEEVEQNLRSKGFTGPIIQIKGISS